MTTSDDAYDAQLSRIVYDGDIATLQGPGHGVQCIPLLDRRSGIGPYNPAVSDTTTRPLNLPNNWVPTEAFHSYVL